METLQHDFPLHHAHPMSTPPVPAPGMPLMPNSPREAHVVVDLPNTPEIMIVSSDDEPMEGFEGHLEEEDDPEEQ